MRAKLKDIKKVVDDAEKTKKAAMMEQASSCNRKQFPFPPCLNNNISDSHHPTKKGHQTCSSPSML